MVKISVEHQGRRWTEWVAWEHYRERLKQLLEMGAAIYWVERED